MSDLPFAPVLSLIGLTLGLASAANAACLDLKRTNALSFEGTLNYRIFAGPPNYEDVRKGDTPEPTYILTLAEPICASGDEFVDPRDMFSQIQIFPESPDDAAPALSRDLRRWVGKRVVVEGTSAFGAHTGHHHAPLMLPITREKNAPGGLLGLKPDGAHRAPRGYWLCRQASERGLIAQK
jgi:hypothetical protein